MVVEALWDGIARLRSSAWIAEALRKTDRQTKRDRRLSAESVVMLAVLMGLYREQSIVDLVWKFGLARCAADERPLRSNAITKGRERVGDAPVHALAQRTGTEWAIPSALAHRWRGLALFGIDGSTLRVADSDENRRTFGVHSGGRGGGGLPLLRMVALMALQTHLIVEAVIGGFKGTSEVAFGEQLLPAIVGDSLTLLDRGFLSVWLLHRITSEGCNRHWLTRIKKTTRWTVIQTYGPGDQLVEIKTPDEARRKHPTLPRTWRARLIEYHRAGFRPQALLTSLLDPHQWPAAEIVELYHVRWELELGLDEIKTELLQRKEALRSRTAVGVRQEFWGIIVGYNIIRHEMVRIARHLDVPPVRISFVFVLRVVRERQLLESQMHIGQTAIVARWLRDLLVLPVRRARQYPRAVRKKMTAYPTKRTSAAAA